MAVYRQISSKEIIRKVFRDLRPAEADWIHDAVEWIGEAIEHIGAPGEFCLKNVVIPISNYTGALPGDLYYINQVAVNTCMTPTVKSELSELAKQVKELSANIQTYYTQLNQSVTLSVNGTYNSSLTPSDLEDFDTYHQRNIVQLRELNSRMVVLEGTYFNNSSCLRPLQYGTSTFHVAMHCEGCINEYSSYKHTYIVNCNAIKTSFEAGQICLSYMAFPTDEDCWPLVADDVSVREALFWNIAKHMLMAGYTISNKQISYQYAEHQWLTYCTQARNALQYPDMDQYRSFMDQWVRLAPDLNRDLTFYQSLNDREAFVPDNI